MALVLHFKIIPAEIICFFNQLTFYGDISALSPSNCMAKLTFPYSLIAEYLSEHKQLAGLLLTCTFQIQLFLFVRNRVWSSLLIGEKVSTFTCRKLDGMMSVCNSSSIFLLLKFDESKGTMKCFLCRHSHF